MKRVPPPLSESGTTPDSKTANARATIVLWIPDKVEATATTLALSKAGIANVTTSSVGEVCREIEQGVGAAVIAEEALSQGNLEELCAVLKAQPPWSDFPFIVLTSAPETGSRCVCSEEDLSRLGSLTLLDRPLRTQTLVNAVESVLRARRRQYQVRDLLAQRERSVQRLQLLAGMASHLLSADNPQEILDDGFAKLSSQLRLDFYFNYLVDERTGNLRLHACAGVPREVAEKMEWIDLAQTGLKGLDPSLMPVLTERTTTLDDPHTGWLRSLGVKAYATYPLIARQRFIGTLSFATARRDHFTPEELSIMETVCNQIAIAMERRRAEEQIKSFNQVLERKVEERTEALNETNEHMQAFAYSVSHDLQAPLRAIRGFSQILLSESLSRLDAVGQDYLQRIDRSAERMQKLIQDLLAYSRLSRADYTPEKIGIDGCILTVLNQLDDDIRQKNAEISVKRPLLNVFGHPAPLEQIISNLVSNAVKFSKPKSSPKVEIWTERHQDTVRLFVQDNGIGILPEHRERIFGIFERLHNSFPGTGMGLAIVKKAAERMGGSVGLDSTPGEGSRFWVELPADVSEDRQEEPLVSEPVAAGANSRSAR